MAYFALIYEVVDDFVARRAPFRDEHLRLAAESHARGEIVLAGAFAEPADAALIIFRSADLSTAEEFARHDLYVTNGLVKKWTVRPWTVVVGQQPDRPPSLSGRLQ
jgi:uncharacterized protein YciI